VTYQVDEQLMNLIYETLKFYANTYSYEAPRIGGVVAGCPRGPKPTAEQLAWHASRALDRINVEVLGRPAQETRPARMQELNEKFAGRERGDDWGELTPRLSEETSHGRKCCGCMGDEAYKHSECFCACHTVNHQR
jgi:hypothetical protein